MHGLERAEIIESMAAAPGVGREVWKSCPLPGLHRMSEEPRAKGAGALFKRKEIYLQ